MANLNLNTKDIDKNLLKVVLDFDKQYIEEANKIASSIIFGRIVSKKILAKMIADAMTPIINDMFDEGIIASNKLVKREIAKLVVDVDVPFKFNKDLIERINEKSIFTGYFDKEYKGIFTKGEIQKLKNTILSAKYSKWDEKQTAAAIKKVTNFSSRRALFLARTETQRLQETAMSVYMEKSAVNKNFDRIWRTQGDGKVRGTHQRMNGLKADSNGQFNSPDVGLVNGPGAGPADFSMGCRCYTEFIKKE